MKNKNATIAFDIDGTLADLMTAWLKMYNNDYGDSLCPSDITDWDVSKFVLPKCSKKIFKYIGNPKIYDFVLPIDGSLNAVNSVRDSANVVFVTSISGNTAGRKREWLVDNGFYKKGDVYIEASDKSAIDADLLIDDYPVNIESFYGKDGRGIGIIFSQHWNMKFDWPLRIPNWNFFIEISRHGGYRL